LILDTDYDGFPLFYLPLGGLEVKVQRQFKAICSYTFKV